jgi:hypothetical protein
MSASCYPSLYQINTRVWLTELSRKLGRSATLDDIPDTELDRLVELGFDWVWLLSVWQTGLGAQQVSRTNQRSAVRVCSYMRFVPGKSPTGFSKRRTGWSGGFRHPKDMTPRHEAAHSVVHSHS